MITSSMIRLVDASACAWGEEERMYRSAVCLGSMGSVLYFFAFAAAALALAAAAAARMDAFARRQFCVMSR